MKGYIVVVEGTDGCGKQTQTTKLYEVLKNKGYNVIKQSFPNYDSMSAGPVKMYLNGEFGSNANGFDAYQASVIYAVDRLCTMQKLKEHYNNGGVIIFDRYVQSNMLHQCGKIEDVKERDKYLEWLDNLEFNILKLPRPDRVIFLDMPIKFSKTLAENRGNYKTGNKKDIHEQDENHLVNAYKAGKYVAQKYKWNVINCIKEDKIKSIDEIYKEIFDICYTDIKKAKQNISSLER